jgi:hypothetical protein
MEKAGEKKCCSLALYYNFSENFSARWLRITRKFLQFASSVLQNFAVR